LSSFVRRKHGHGKPLKGLLDTLDQRCIEVHWVDKRTAAHRIVVGAEASRLRADPARVKCWRGLPDKAKL
jgi:hypothetical protein